MNKPDNNVDKIDVEELIKDFKVMNVNNFISYLKEIWRVYKLNPGSRS
jgi:hypothetical protein